MSEKLLPPNATPLERAIVELIDRRFSADAFSVPIEPLWDIENCPEALLPWLAWAVSADAWHDGPDGWSLETRREVLRTNSKIHKRKGTVASVKESLATQGVIVDLTEWWQATPPDAPHTFFLELCLNSNFEQFDAKELTGEFYDTLCRDVDAVKPARSHYEFRLKAVFDGGLVMGDSLSFSSFAVRKAQLLHQEKSFNINANVTSAAALNLFGFSEHKSRLTHQEKTFNIDARIRPAAGLSLFGFSSFKADPRFVSLRFKEGMTVRPASPLHFFGFAYVKTTPSFTKVSLGMDLSVVTVGAAHLFAFVNMRMRVAQDETLDPVWDVAGGQVS